MKDNPGKSGNIFGTPMDASDQTGSITTKKVGLGLGYFSIGLGLLEVAAPGRLARWLGVENKAAKNTIFGFGLRELLAGGMLLRGPAVSTNVWNRVIGDTIDAGALGIAATRSSRPWNVALAGGIVAGAFVADLLTARALDKKTARTFPRLSRPGDPLSASAGSAAHPELVEGPNDPVNSGGSTKDDRAQQRDVKVTNLEPADLAAV